MIESTFKDKAFEAFVMKVYEEDNREIFPIEYEGQRYWVKKGRQTSSNLFHKLCYKLLPFEFLIPVECKTEEEAILFESTKLQTFKDKGLNVPEVIGINSKFFVMSDSGEQIYVAMRKADISKETLYDYLNKYLEEVCRIHNNGFYHGGAQGRNFTHKEGKVYAIDLEDSFGANVDIKTLQFRDLLLILLTMTKINSKEINYKYIVDFYVKRTSNQDFIKQLKHMGVKLNFLTKLNHINLLDNLLPRDVKEFCHLLDELNKL